MKISKFRNSKFLKKDDVLAMTDKQRQTVVEKITEEEIGEEKELKPLCYFKGFDKPWVINMTALDELHGITGSDDTDDYVGTPVEVYVDPSVRYQGKRVGGIKIRGRKEGTGSDPVPFDDSLDDVAY